MVKSPKNTANRVGLYTGGNNRREVKERNVKVRYYYLHCIKWQWSQIVASSKNSATAAGTSGVSVTGRGPGKRVQTGGSAESQNLRD